MVFKIFENKLCIIARNKVVSREPPYRDKNLVLPQSSRSYNLKTVKVIYKIFGI